ncbi:MAG: hypothetical protein H6710_03565 [Myxococcales bacterium]|nr:hypothetical protein [Myxococcales bacterium]MCB9702656.1 hypothetical protein [Myxococcales bacterium]
MLALVTLTACSGDDAATSGTASEATGDVSSGSVGGTTSGATTSGGRPSTTGASSGATTSGDPTGTSASGEVTTAVTVGGETDSTAGSGGTDTGGGECCEPLLAPGCGDPSVAECVCAQDEFCCVEQWDGQCVQEVEAFGCGVCGGMVLGCCDAHQSPSCDDDAVAACVCAQDDFCCAESWDEQCAMEVTLFGCGSCGGGGDEECCLPHGTPGCALPEVEACVCAQNPFCCEDMWDEACVAAVDELGCGVCEGPPPGPCCEAHGGLGCDDPGIAACVCEIAPGCCEKGWDEICAGLVEFLECGLCEAPPVAECCAAHDTPGCDDLEVEACVCAQDPLCCEAPWSDVCVAEVEAFGCGLCGGGDACCEVHPSPGCMDPQVTACVCAQDDFCCQESWDQACVDGVELYGCGSCGGEDSCCLAHAAPGCADQDVEACVCALDDFCCQVGWDDVCVEEVTTFGCGVCE